MMFFIRTSGIEGQDINNFINNFYHKEAIYVDKDYRKCDGVRIISIYQLIRQYQDGDRVIIPVSYFDEEEISYLKDMGIKGKDIAVFCDGEMVEYDTFTYLSYLEFHVNDHCNLNCKGCSHFCPLIKDEVYTDLEQVKKDFIRLRQLIDYIKIIRIMGGEPLLNTKLDEYIKTVRDSYPLADIRIVTNGILIKSLSDRIWDSFRNNNVAIDISFYPPLIQRADDIISDIRSHGVTVGNIRNVSSFEKILHEKKKIIFDKTISCICNNLHDGYIASCQLVFYGKYYNARFNTDIPFESGLINLYDERLNGKNLMMMLNRPFEACDYCNQASFGINPVESKWESRNRLEDCRESDWFV